MCRSLVSVDWQGYLYDCDFNQQLGLAIGDGAGGRLHITRAIAAHRRRRRSGSPSTATAAPPARVRAAAARWATTPPRHQAAAAEGKWQ
jgi:hypothetical protein